MFTSHAPIGDIPPPLLGPANCFTIYGNIWIDVKRLIIILLHDCMLLRDLLTGLARLLRSPLELYCYLQDGCEQAVMYGRS